MSRTIRLALFALVFAAGLAAGCKSSGCSSCGAQAPIADERRPAVAAAPKPKVDANVRLAAATEPAGDCTA
jgi:hypothetical protein